MSFPCSTWQNLEGILVAHWKGNTALKWGRNNCCGKEKGARNFLVEGHKRSDFHNMQSTGSNVRKVMMHALTIIVS